MGRGGTTLQSTLVEALRSTFISRDEFQSLADKIDQNLLNLNTSVEGLKSEITNTSSSFKPISDAVKTQSSQIADFLRLFKEAQTATATAASSSTASDILAEVTNALKVPISEVMDAAQTMKSFPPVPLVTKADLQDALKGVEETHLKNAKATLNDVGAALMAKVDSTIQINTNYLISTLTDIASSFKEYVDNAVKTAAPGRPEEPTTAEAPPSVFGFDEPEASFHQKGETAEETSEKETAEETSEKETVEETSEKETAKKEETKER